MQQKLEKRLKKIKKITDSKDYPYENLFTSNKGKIFSNHVEETEDFCRKYFILTLLGKFNILIQKVLQWTQTEEYQKLIGEKVKAEEDKEMLELFQKYQQLNPRWMEEPELDILTDEKEQMRFITYLTVTLVSYFEIYARDSIDRIQDKIIQNNEYYEKKFGVKVKEILKQLNKKEKNNASLQIDNLLKSFNIKQTVNSLLLKNDLKDYSKIVSAIIELRNKIIHHEPFPDMSILDVIEIRPLKKYIESNLINVDIKGMDDIDDYTKAPTIVQTIFDELLNIFRPKIMFMTLLQKIPEIINLYAGLIDNIVDLYFMK